jgi:hypothetical protein
MFIELLVISSAVQRDLLNAYEASGRIREVGLYMLVQNVATLNFFETITPPPNCQKLYEAYMKWQKLGVQTLEADLGGKAPTTPNLARDYEDSANAFARAMQAFSQSADPADAS